MNSEKSHDPILWSTVSIAFLVALTAVAGIWWPATYANEALFARAGGIASDQMDLFLVVPILVVSGIRAYRGSTPARLVWLGTLGYLIYNFVLYAFGVRFNALFLVYCATLSLCLSATVFGVSFIPLGEVARAYDPRAPRKTIAIAFLLLALAYAAFDLREIVPALLSGRGLQSAAQAGTPVNFMYVLDLAYLVPAMCIAAVLLLRRKASGYALAPAMLALLAIMNTELAVLFVVMSRMGCFPMIYPMVVSFLVLALGFTILLGFYFSSARKTA
jgi:hypothetical protein